MYYLGIVIDQLISADGGIRRADPHHVRRAARTKRTHGEPGAGSASARV